jgi:DNA-binding NarL/FixJ family response regulator
MKRIRIVIVDDHMIVRQGLKMLLQGHEDVEVVGEAENGWQAVRVAKETKPEIVLMDLAMPSLNGIDATRHILREVPGTRVLVLSSYGDEQFVQQMTEAGAVGYLIKQTAAADLLTAIREVHNGHAFYSPAIARRMRDQTRAAFAKGSNLKSRELTGRETQVLELIARGLSNKEMSVQLGISVKTIEKHRQQVMDKLDIHHTAGLTLYAINRRMVDPNTPPVEQLGTVVAG